MKHSNWSVGRHLGQAPLALCLASLFTSPLSAAVSPRPAGTTPPVTSCADDGSPDTLRSLMMSAPSGATIDLSQLTCNTITLEQGAIDIGANYVTLIGPGADRLTIDGNNQSGIFNGALIEIDGLTLTRGRVSGDFAGGGCISGFFGVVLRNSRVVSCSAYGTQSASGGGISSAYGVELFASTVADNVAVAGAGYAYGGGISARYTAVTAQFSTISGNRATGNPARGGGVFAFGHSLAMNSTIDGNTADFGGGWYCVHSFFDPAWCQFVDSTISGNTARDSGGGIFVYSADNVDTIDIRNSTIAFNTAQSGFVGGVLLTGRSSGTAYITLQSSIFANNTAAITDLAPDINSDSASPPVTGGDDLLMTVGNIRPATFITDDPLLAPLADNGGPTRTHALPPDSPAIDAGNNIAALDTDQRGRSRVSGSAADIGSYEFQTDSIFTDSFD